MDSDKQARIEFASKIDKLISEELPGQLFKYFNQVRLLLLWCLGCGVHVYGSSLTGIAVKNADLNLDFVVAKELSAPDMLLKAFQILSASSLAA